MKISKKKPSFKIKHFLKNYLERYDRRMDLPVKYKDLFSFQDSFPLYDKHGENTLWDSLLYDEYQWEDLQRDLILTYSYLKTEGDLKITKHLKAERVDFCQFANSQPFRIKIVNLLNDNHDYMYVKKGDASRVYGLELEHILSPNHISYLVDGDTLIEEHIAGIPGDQFFEHYMDSPNFNKVRFAKEFIKFNERCFIRLLGDMRAYNWVVEVTPDFEDEQYRIRAIDFDQQSYEGKKSIYLPQYFKENNPVIEMGMEFMTWETTRQYQFEERTLMARRLNLAQKRLKQLMRCMKKDTISTPEKIKELAEDLNEFHNSRNFDSCDDMGDILGTNLAIMLRKHIRKLDLK